LQAILVMRGAEAEHRMTNLRRVVADEIPGRAAKP